MGAIERDFWNAAERFLGGSLEYRRHGTSWPAPWRARIVASKNERDDYRVTAYGATQDEACERCLAALPDR
jgi:hypothetical protein